MAGFEDDAEIETPAPMARPGKRTAADPVTKESLTTEKPTPESENMLTPELAPIDVLHDEAKRNGLYAQIRKEIAEQKPDLSTQAGRDRVKSFAFKITRTRTAVIAAGKASTEELRKQTKAVNDLCNLAETAFKTLEAEARKPLTEWEEAEAAKASERREILRDIARAIEWAGRSNPPLSAAEAREIVEQIEAIVIDQDLWLDEIDNVTARQNEALTILRSKIEAAELREENERLRAAAEASKPAPAADPEPDPIEQLAPRQETTSEAPPAAEAPAASLTPIQQARRLALPALASFGVEGDTAKRLILAIEAGKIPGITATYTEN